MAKARKGQPDRKRRTTVFDFGSTDPGPTTTRAHRDRAYAKALAVFAKVRNWNRLKAEAYYEQYPLDPETIHGLLYLRSRLSATGERKWSRIGKLREAFKAGATKPSEIRHHHPEVWKDYRGDVQALSRDLYRIRRKAIT